MAELARPFSRIVVADGIETPDQAAAARALGCPLGQGFLFGRPQPINELTGTIRDALVQRRTATPA